MTFYILCFEVPFFFFFIKSTVAASEERFWPRDSDKSSGSFVLILESEYYTRLIVSRVPRVGHIPEEGGYFYSLGGGGKFECDQYGVLFNTTSNFPGRSMGNGRGRRFVWFHEVSCTKISKSLAVYGRRKV